MSDNPFDVFAADFKAAIPSTNDKAGNQNDQPISIMAQPSPAPVPVMNAPAAPVMNQQGAPGAPGAQTQQQPPMAMNGMGGQTMGGMGMMNAPPAPQQGMYGGYGMNGMGGGMMQQQPSLYGAPTMMGGMQGAPAPGAMIPSAQQSNPYAMNMGAMGGMPGAPAPYGQPMTMGGGATGQFQQQPQPATPGMPPAPPSAAAPGMPPAPTTVPPPESAPAVPPPSSDPFGQPAPPTAAPVPVPPAPASSDPFGQPAPPTAAPVPVPPAPAFNDPFGQPAPPTAAPAAVAPAVPFGAPQPPDAQPPMPPSQFHGQTPQPPVPSNDPWAQQPAPPAPVPAANDAIVPVPNGVANDDPFGVFNQGPPPPSDVLSVATPNPAHQYTSEQVQAAADDPWNSGPFATDNAAPAPTNTAPAPGNAAGGGLLDDGALVPVAAGGPGGDEGHNAGELPPGGEWYDARIFTPTLGVMFFKPQELTDSLFLQTEKSLIDALNDRPVVAFIVEGSSARAAGVELGHVLLKVNGIDVKNPKEASRLIKEGPRPLPLLFYVPDTNVVVAEGEHMVKYDTRDTTAPNSAKDWKPKYVVIGGIIAQPWMMNMYRSKSEYDIAVIETQARRPVSVKVKQFSLQGARIQNDWQGPQMVKYKNKLHPWKYIVILPISRNPIKISSPNLAQLKPVHEGVRRVLMAQQRHAPSPSRTDPYGGQGQRVAGNPYPPQQQNHNQPPPQQQYGHQQGQYGGQPQQQYGHQQGQYANEGYNPAGGMSSARRRSEY